MTEQTVCVAAGIQKKFRSRTALSTVDLRVQPSEVVAVTGPSGSGKSTLLNILGLLEPVETGSLSLFGKSAPSVGSPRATRLRRTRLGYLFQNYALIDNQTVEANLKIAQAYVQGRTATLAKARAQALEQVDLPEVHNRKVYELSGGEQQRVALARLLLKPCQLVLADEPTGSLDPVNRDIVLDLLKALSEQGKSVIIVTHDDAVVGRCDREVVLIPAIHDGLRPATSRVSQST